jgi:formiminoglutamate deiminase
VSRAGGTSIFRGGGDVNRYFCDAAFLGGEAAEGDVLLTVDGDRFAAVEPGAARPGDAVHLRGLTLPGFANAHSHAFHRVLRGRTERPGTFWTWREQMYEVAAVLDPGRYHRLARAVFAEMALTGITAVGEFHYLHHPPAGGRYRDPNEMGSALFAAAGEAGVRITLLDTCYLEAGPGRPADGVQLRFSDGDASRWAERADEIAPPEGARAGAAIHSVRAVPPGAARTVAEWAGRHDAPLHFHLSEQRAENDDVSDAYGASPASVLGGAGALGESATAVHATHVGPADTAAVGGSGTGVCMCPTTERALADGIGPAAALAGAGSPVSLGTDSHALIDFFEEMRALELDQRLATGTRGHFSAGWLLRAAAGSGHAAIGWPEAGRIAAGSLADLVTVSRDSPRLAGAGTDNLLEHAVFAASPADVTDVITSGRPIVRGGRHLLLGDVSTALRSAIAEVSEAVGTR